MCCGFSKANPMYEIKAQTTTLLSNLSALLNIWSILLRDALKAELAVSAGEDWEVTKADSCSWDFCKGEWTLKYIFIGLQGVHSAAPWINNKLRAGDPGYNYPPWSSSLVTTMSSEVNMLSGAMAFMSSCSLSGRSLGEGCIQITWTCTFPSDLNY